MKLHFEDNLDYQKTAIEAVADLFSGQDINRTEFTVSKMVDPTGRRRSQAWKSPPWVSETAYSSWMTSS